MSLNENFKCVDVQVFEVDDDKYRQDGSLRKGTGDDKRRALCINRNGSDKLRVIQAE